VHMFKYNGRLLVYDVNSSSLHQVDELGWEVIASLLQGKTCEDVKTLLEGKFLKNDVEEALQQVEDLVKARLLFTLPPIATNGQAPSYNVKALCLFISEKCNLNCRYCFATEHNSSSSHMSWEVGKRAVDFLLNSTDSPFVEMDFFGGEPLLNFDLVKDVVAYARKWGPEKGKLFNFTLTTNALLLNEHIIDFLNEENISVILSLDGRPEVQDKMRPTLSGEGSYTRTVKNIKSFLQKRNNGDYFIRGTFTSNNLDFSCEVEHLLEQGFTSLSLEPVVAGENTSYGLQEEHLPALEKEYDRLVDLYLQEKNKGRPFRFYHFDMDLEEGPCIYKRVSSCGAGVEYLAVSANGDIYPCHQFCGEKEFYMGNILQDNFSPDKNIRELMAEAPLKREDCKTCWARYLCGRGCAATSYFLGGSLTRPHSLSCALQKMRLERALYLQAV